MTASRLRLFGSLLAMAVTSTACSVEPSTPEPPAPPEKTQEADAPKTTAPLEFVATYPATLLYALDGAAGLRNHDAGYRRWLVGNEDPAWLEAYAARRNTWDRKRRNDAGGGAAAFDVCGWTSQTVEELKVCLDDVVPALDRTILMTALDESDRLLQPKWPAVEARFATLKPELDAALSTDHAAELFRILRREASLPEDTKLRFKVVLVGKPKSDHSFARQAGEHLVHEVDENTAAGSLLGVAFHEIAHLAHHMSPERAAFERSFMDFGDSGKLAANLWDEVVATAFGNGLAAEVFDPKFGVERSFYADEWIDVLGRALYLEWKAGLDVRLGAGLAKDLTRLVDAKWPLEKRSMARLLWYVTVTADDRAALDAAFEGIDVRSGYRSRPIDETMSAQSDLPPWASRIVLATPEQLAAHPALAERVGMDEGSWTSELAAHDTAVFRRTESDGTLLFVVLGKDAPTLAKAMPSLARRPRIVSEGWTSW
jgi:hypothetical protein